MEPHDIWFFAWCGVFALAIGGLIWAVIRPRPKDRSRGVSQESVDYLLSVERKYDRLMGKGPFPCGPVSHVPGVLP